MTAPPFCYSFTTRLQDTDAAGVLFFANLFRHAHNAYEAFMEELGFPLDCLIRDRQWHLPIVRTEAAYRRAIAHGDRIAVRVLVTEVGHSAFTLAYRFDNPAGQAVADARTVHVAVAPGEERSRALPAQLAGALRSRLLPV